MSIAPTVERYLEAHDADYEIVPHRRTGPSIRTADALGIDGDELIKVVVVEDDRHYAAVLLPASMHVELGAVRAALGRQCGLATEDELVRLFDDCDRGSVPAVPQAYHLQALVDVHATRLDVVYLEAGDCGAVLQMSGEAFRRLMSDAAVGPFAVRGDRRA